MINSDGRTRLTLLIIKILMYARLEFKDVLGFRRVAVSRIDLRGASYVGVKNEPASKDISRALRLVI